MNEKNYVLSVSRLEVCDLMLACTGIVCDMRTEMLTDPDCPEYRRNHVLPESMKKWQRLHDKLKKQLDILDALNVPSDDD